MLLLAKHLVFYDAQCGLCNRSVQFIIQNDKTQCFVFAPLDGTTAKIFLPTFQNSLNSTETLILVENYRSEHPHFYAYGKGALRIAWHLGGKWALLGWLSFLPGFFFNWAYRLLARNRHLFLSSPSCDRSFIRFKDRFLP